MFRYIFLLSSLFLQGFLISDEALAQTASNDPRCKEFEKLKSEAAERDPKALFKLSFMYSNDLCVREDSKKAAELLKSSADMGYPPALYFFAAYLDKGGRSDLALPYALQGAERGNPQAQSLTAYLYLEGKGIVNDDDEAAKWAKRAAAQGEALGLRILGALYAEGTGVKKDWVEADKWLILAVHSSSTDAQLVADQKTIESRLSPQEVTKVHRWIDAWKPILETQPGEK